MSTSRCPKIIDSYNMTYLRITSRMAKLRAEIARLTVVVFSKQPNNKFLISNNYVCDITEVGVRKQNFALSFGNNARIFLLTSKQATKRTKLTCTWMVTLFVLPTLKLALFSSLVIQSVRATMSRRFCHPCF